MGRIPELSWTGEANSKCTVDRDVTSLYAGSLLALVLSYQEISAVKHQATEHTMREGRCTLSRHIKAYLTLVCFQRFFLVVAL